MSYNDQAKAAAVNMALHFKTQLAEALIDEYFVNFWDIDSFYDYHHHTNMKTASTLLEAATILSELEDHLETDKGLWLDMSPHDAIKVQAAYTYGNAILSHFDKIASDLQDDPEIDKFLKTEDVPGLTQFLIQKLPNFYPTNEAKQAG